MDVGTNSIIVFAGIVMLALVVAYLASRYKVAGPDEALLRYDYWHRDEPPKVLRGPGGMLVWPVRHTLGRLQLGQLSVTRRVDAYTSDDRAATVRLSATYRVGDGDVAVRDAADRYLTADLREVDADVADVVADALRAKAGTTTLLDLEARQDELEDAVRSASNAELARSGLVVDGIGIEVIAIKE